VGLLIQNGTTPTILFLMVDATDGETAELGLSPTVEISKNGGAFAATTNSAVEISDGWYAVTLTADETDTDGVLAIRATAAGADEWRDYHQVYSNLSAIVTGASVTVTGPVLESGNIRLVQGDDYSVTSGQALEWSSADWPDLTGGSAHLYAWLNSSAGTATFDKAGTVLNAGSATQTVRVTPGTADTAALVPHTIDGGGYTFQVKATLAGGEVVTLVQGLMTVEPDVSA
jgi:hypothetical protein